MELNQKEFVDLLRIVGLGQDKEESEMEDVLLPKNGCGCPEGCNCDCPCHGCGTCGGNPCECENPVIEADDVNATMVLKYDFIAPKSVVDFFKRYDYVVASAAEFDIKDNMVIISNIPVDDVEGFKEIFMQIQDMEEDGEMVEGIDETLINQTHDVMAHDYVTRGYADTTAKSVGPTGAKHGNNPYSTGAYVNKIEESEDLEKELLEKYNNYLKNL